MFVSKYLVKLPEKKVLENFMKRELNQWYNYFFL
jgi:hypothetical protein